MHKIITCLLAIIWLANGLFCKVLNLVPRHQEIVAALLGNDHAVFFTRMIGASEIIMAAWILSGYKSRLNAVVQMIVIAAMNTLEAIQVPHLLLFGRWNAILASVLIVSIYLNQFRGAEPKPSLK